MTLALQAIYHGATPQVADHLGDDNIATTSGYLHARPDSSSGLKLDPGLWTRPSKPESFKENPNHGPARPKPIAALFFVVCRKRAFRSIGSDVRPDAAHPIKSPPWRAPTPNVYVLLTRLSAQHSACPA